MSFHTRLEALRDLKAKVEAGGNPHDEMLAVFPDLGVYQHACHAAVSLDAALALHEAVLPRWDYEVRKSYVRVWVVPSRSSWQVLFRALWEAMPFVKTESPIIGYEFSSATPARAWLIAVLAVLIEQEENP
jgi:hypothetical protein